jgi:hypothetical protein
MTRPNKLERLSLETLSSQILDSEGKAKANQMSISPTFYQQLLRQNPFAKKLQTQIVST